MSKHFVLVHGAWHGGWVYDEAIKLLEAAGHTAEAPTYPGNSPGDDRSGITFDQIVDSLVGILQKQEGRSFWLGIQVPVLYSNLLLQKRPTRLKGLFFTTPFCYLMANLSLILCHLKRPRV